MGQRMPLADVPARPLPAVQILFGGVVGAGAGSMIMYAGALESGEATENIFAEDAGAAAAAKAHSVSEPAQAKLKAASVSEPRQRGWLRGFAASFL